MATWEVPAVLHRVLEPTSWAILKIDLEEDRSSVVFKILSIVDGTWRINSGITDIEKDRDDSCLVTGLSGTRYRLYYDRQNKGDALETYLRRILINEKVNESSIEEALDYANL